MSVYYYMAPSRRSRRSRRSRNKRRSVKSRRSTQRGSGFWSKLFGKKNSYPSLASLPQLPALQPLNLPTRSPSQPVHRQTPQQQQNMYQGMNDNPYGMTQNPYGYENRNQNDRFSDPYNDPYSAQYAGRKKTRRETS